MKIYGEQIPVEMIILSPENRKYTRNFFCNNPSIDNYYRKKAVKDNSSVTYLFVNSNDNSVIACVTIACSAIFTDTDEKNVFSTILSAMEIKYFAVNEIYQHIPYVKGSSLRQPRVESLMPYDGKFLPFSACRH